MEVRKTVTVLFCDWVSSTALGEQLDPETLRNVQSRWFRVAEDVLLEHGGTVEKFIGDAVMAVFGLPEAHEDDALRAVRAAVRMGAELSALNDELERELEIRLALRTGITTGEVVAGDATLRQSLVTGDVVNTAKRLEEAAPPDGILVGATTRELVAMAASLERAPDITAKGKRLEVPAWRVVDVDLDAPSIARRFDTPLVGRVEELDRLARAVERAERERRALVATVVGPAGIGKSRLVRELVDSLGERATVLAGKCVAYGGTTYRPLVEILRDAGGPGGVGELLTGQEDGVLVIERLDAAAGISAATFATDEIFWAVRRFVELTARARPLVLVIEDAHWAQATFHDLIDYLASFVTDAPLTIVRLGRPELLEGRSVPSDGETLELGPLSDPHARELLAGAGAPKALSDRIVTVAEGNPLFLEQLAAVAAESDGEEVPIPPTIDAVLAARLDQLPDEQLRILERGSVVGRRFESRVLIELLPPEARNTLTPALLSLTRAGLIRPAPGAAGADRYRFAHGLVRDAAYARIPKATRAGLHETLARRLQRDETRGPGADDLAGHHLEQASRALAELGRSDPAATDLADEAAALLQGAGKRAAARDDIPAAIALFERAEVLAVRARSPLLGSIRHGLGRGLWEIGENDRALRVLETAIDDAMGVGDLRSEWLARLDRSAFQLVRGAANDLRAVAEQAVDVLTSMQDDAALALAWRRLAFADRREGRYGASVEPSARALAHARAAADAYEETRAIDSLCTGLLYGPTPATDAVAQCREVLAGADRPAIQANVLASLAELEAMLGNLDAARDAYARSRGIYEELGLRMPLAGLTTIGVELELLAGDPVAAEAEARRGIAILEGSGLDTELAPMLAEALLAQGRDSEATAALDGIEDAGHAVPWQVRVRTARARLYAGRGLWDEAVDEAQDAVARAGALDDVNLSADAYAALASVLLLAGREDDAGHAMDAARERYDIKENVVGARAMLASSRRA